MTESEIQHAIRLELGRMPGLRIFRNNSGVAIDGESGRAIRYGLARGSSDLVGILAPTGRIVCLEVKTPTGRVSREQVMWLQLVRALGGFATVVRSVQDARDAVERARKGESE